LDPKTKDVAALNDPDHESWTVWRIDDNGNTFVVQEHLTREEAERLVAEFTARGHKQSYWVERSAQANHRGTEITQSFTEVTTKMPPCLRG